MPDDRGLPDINSYIDLIDRFLRRSVSAPDFQLTYLRMVKNERRILGKPAFPVLQELFEDADRYVDEPSAESRNARPNDPHVMRFAGEGLCGTSATPEVVMGCLGAPTPRPNSAGNHPPRSQQPSRPTTRLPAGQRRHRSPGGTLPAQKLPADQQCVSNRSALKSSRGTAPRTAHTNHPRAAAPDPRPQDHWRRTRPRQQLGPFGHRHHGRRRLGPELPRD